MLYKKTLRPAGLAGIILFTAVLLAACANLTADSRPPAEHATHGQPADPSVPQPDHDEGEHGDGEHGAMGHGAAFDPDLPFDAQFIDSMIQHHVGAVEMAHEVLRHSTRPELRALAEEIIAAQSAEIEMMEDWRNAWYPDLGPTPGLDMHMGEMEIAQDDGRPFDQRFLEAMIDHHAGAIEMAQLALEQAERAELRAMARDVIEVQQAEIEQMEAWLAEWFGSE